MESFRKQIAAHPKVSVMVEVAIRTLGKRNGSSLHAINKFIAANYSVNIQTLSFHIKKHLKSAVESGDIIQTSGRGAVGSFKLNKQKKIAEAKLSATEAKSFISLENLTLTPNRTPEPKKRIGITAILNSNLDQKVRTPNDPKVSTHSSSPKPKIADVLKVKKRVKSLKPANQILTSKRTLKPKKAVSKSRNRSYVQKVPTTDDQEISATTSLLQLKAIVSKKVQKPKISLPTKAKKLKQISVKKVRKPKSSPSPNRKLENTGEKILTASDQENSACSSSPKPKKADFQKVKNRAKSLKPFNDFASTTKRTVKPKKAVSKSPSSNTSLVQKVKTVNDQEVSTASILPVPNKTDDEKVKNGKKALRPAKNLTSKAVPKSPDSIPVQKVQAADDRVVTTQDNSPKSEIADAQEGKKRGKSFKCDKNLTHKKTLKPKKAFSKNLDSSPRQKVQTADEQGPSLAINLLKPKTRDYKKIEIPKTSTSIKVKQKKSVVFENIEKPNLSPPPIRKLKNAQEKGRTAASNQEMSTVSVLPVPKVADAQIIKKRTKSLKPLKNQTSTPKRILKTKKAVSKCTDNNLVQKEQLADGQELSVSISPIPKIIISHQIKKRTKPLKHLKKLTSTPKRIVNPKKAISKSLESNPGEKVQTAGD